MGKKDTDQAGSSRQQESVHPEEQPSIVSLKNETLRDSARSASRVENKIIAVTQSLSEGEQDDQFNAVFAHDESTHVSDNLKVISRVHTTKKRLRPFTNKPSQSNR